MGFRWGNSGSLIHVTSDVFLECSEVSELWIRFKFKGGNRKFLLFPILHRFGFE